MKKTSESFPSREDARPYPTIPNRDSCKKEIDLVFDAMVSYSTGPWDGYFLKVFSKEDMEEALQLSQLKKINPLSNSTSVGTIELMVNGWNLNALSIMTAPTKCAVNDHLIKADILATQMFDWA